MLHLSTKTLSLVGVFAGLHTILYLMSFELWRNWAIYLEPIEGIVFGPWAGFLVAFIGGVIGRAIKPIDFWMFGIIAEPLGVLAAGFLAKGRWKPVVVIYAIMLVAYFMHPFGRWFPLWTVIDVLLAFPLIYPASKLSSKLFKSDVKFLPIPLALVSFISAVTDSLARIFLFIPVGLYNLFALTPETVYSIFVSGAVYSYFEDILVIAVSLLAGVPLLTRFKKLLKLEAPLT